MKRIIAIVVLLVFGFWPGAWAFRVSPGAFTAQGVEIGKRIDTGLDLAVDGELNRNLEFSAKVVKPLSPRKGDLSGYSVIPDTKFFFLEKEKFLVPAGGREKSRIYFEIPNEEKYYNQHWIVSCRVEPISTAMFKPSISTTYLIETKSSSNPKERPFGNLGVAPSVVNLTSQKNGYFKIYNNTTGARTYRLKVFKPKLNENELTISNTRSFVWLEDLSWLKLSSDKLKLKKGEVGKVNLSVSLPKQVDPNLKREAIVFVESNKKEINFVRVWIEK